MRLDNLCCYVIHTILIPSHTIPKSQTIYAKAAMKSIELENKVVFITGASTGIGRELSRCFAQEKARLILATIPSEKDVLDSWSEELKKTYKVEVTAITGDLAELDGPEKLYGQVKAIHPQIDVLVNNAGTIAFGTFHETPFERHERVINVNLRAYTALMHLFLPDMVKRRSGHVFNVGSMSAFAPTPQYAIYGAGKMFIQSLTEALREELKGTGVGMFILDPGFTDTALLDMKGTGHKLRSYLMGGFATPAHVAQKGVEAFKKGKWMCIPEFHLWFLVTFLNRFAPRGLITKISSIMISRK